MMQYKMRMFLTVHLQSIFLMKIMIISTITKQSNKAQTLTKTSILPLFSETNMATFITQSHIKMAIKAVTESIKQVKDLQLLDSTILTWLIQLNIRFSVKILNAWKI